MRYPERSKNCNFKRIDSSLISEQILKNALFFLLHGIRHIELEPKQSIVSFWTGVELFFKAFLVEEHWSLIVKDNSGVNHDKYRSGDFVSIDFQQSVRLIENLFNFKFDKKISKSLDTLRKHRNKIVHFTDRDLANKKAIEICDLFVEMSSVWRELRALKRPILDIDKIEIASIYDEISKAIDNHQVILEGKYQRVLKDKLVHLNSDKVFNCSICSYNAVIHSEVHEVLVVSECLVCNDVLDLLKVSCVSCGYLNLFHREENVCKDCDEHIDLISYILNNNKIFTTDVIATCHRCNFKSVIDFESFGFCVKCFSYHLIVDVCKSCGESVSYSTTNSDGCICCDS